MRYTVPKTRTVVEWACIEASHGHLDDGELTLGTHVDLSHGSGLDGECRRPAR